MNSVFLSTRPGAWINLGRIANLPTAWSNILMGSWLARHDFYPTEPLWLLLAASSCFYVGGMILNDVFDYPRDLEKRPERPIPAGLVGLRSAAIVGALLLLAGVGLGIAAAFVCHRDAGSLVKALSVVGLLPLAILSYDKILKNTPFAAPAMGICRSLNVLLGAICGPFDQSGFLGFDSLLLFAAAVIGVYVCGITCFARHETEKNRRKPLWLGAAIIGTALLAMQFLPTFNDLGGLTRNLAVHGFLLMAALLIFWRIGMAIKLARPDRIQQAVITCLFSLILFDALFTLVATPTQPLAALVVASLIIPANFLGEILQANLITNIS